VARRFEISAVLFLAFNTLFALLALREQRSLLLYCEDWSIEGKPGDCLEPYNFFGLELIIVVWIAGALLIGTVAVIFYVNALRESRRAQDV
jgi:hypothetical protein